ncbi:hypothetical protein CTI12_AA020270 [Artemisia annua]|uniref:Uncharacterized protein n=1 Tax=Artemisia annua TaxID=35608 RepID=A0A2U1QK01_ARTAN|nr:hypothetical protein CTI12_AA020270 [Artemisia annua]
MGSLEFDALEIVYMLFDGYRSEPIGLICAALVPSDRFFVARDCLNVVRNRRRQNYRMLYAILKDPAADVMLGAAGSVQRSITEGTRSDDEVNMVARLLIDIANGSSETRTSSGIVPEDRALAETVGRSSVTYIPTNVANGSGHHNREQVGPSIRPKRNGRKPIWMKDYMGDTEEESQ